MATAAALAVAATCSVPASSRLPATARFHLRPTGTPSWIGLKHLGISVRIRNQGHGFQSRGRAVYASLFGVGAPEALVIGVVALLVFGPKGLAEVARTLGKTLRTFQPTIRELQEVSREFKTTLEREIGLDEVQSSLQSTYKPSIPIDEKPTSSIDQNGAQPNNLPFSSKDLLKITEEQLRSSASGIQAQGTNSEDTEVPEAGSTPTTLEVVPAAAATSAESTSPSTALSPTSVEEKLQDQ